MATTPALDEIHSSNHINNSNNNNNNNNHDAASAPIESASSSSPPAPMPISEAQPLFTKSDISLDTKTAMPSLDEGHNQPETQNITDQPNNHESTIKLKRCKHGRIKVKDPSKRKYGQQSDNDANSTGHSAVETNNNRITSINQCPKNDSNQIDKSRSADSNDLVNERPPRITDESTSRIPNSITKVDDRSARRTSELDILDQAIKSGLRDPRQTSKRDEPDPRQSHRHRSRSQSRSKTPTRRSDRQISPERKSRRNNSPRDRSHSRELSRSSRHRRYSPRNRDSSSARRRSSPSPRRRSSPKLRYSRSPSPRLRSKKKKRGGRKMRLRQSLDRQKFSESYRRYHRSPYSRSPSTGRSTRSRSLTPPRRNRRDLSRSPSVEKSNFERYANDARHSIKESIFDKLSQRRSLNGESLPTGAAKEPERKQDHTNATTKPVDSHSSKANPTTQTTLTSKPTFTSTTQQRVPTSGPNFLPKLAQADPDPPENISARSPTTPSNGGSAASDVYDPEEPVLPLSPVDSQPVIEKTDDDVPSSAVQLNQQEKYLQKFHRQERVVEEVKIALRPFYQNRTINKEQYKDVLRKAVPKICHSKNGEISPVKIRSLVDAYVRKMQK